MILDGWGYREAIEDNAIRMANTPNWDSLWQNFSHTLLDTSGESVGLPPGQMGNSEVGHMNIGAGRIVHQDFSRITEAIESGEFRNNPVLCAAIDAAADHTVHIMGLLSPGGVHSHEDHLYATVALAAERGARQICVHAFLDGRDTPPRSAQRSIAQLEKQLSEISGATLGSVCGRYFAMDRDTRWNRVARAWKAIVDGEADNVASRGDTALSSAYERDENDEFVQPTVIADYAGIADGDSLVFVNFRADRARQISQAFVAADFTEFEQRQRPRLAAFVGMTEYLSGLPAGVAFPGTSLPQILPELLAANNLRQLRIAETEKYAHVTFFFNGGREEPFPLEDRKLIPSPNVATYDLQPEMSVPALTEALVAAIRSDAYDVIICNVANADMVGHSGKLDAAIKAVEAVDDCIGQVHCALNDAGGELFITADHGNVEQMRDRHNDQAHTAHTTNPVPLVYTGTAGRLRDGGSLRDIAPTMLCLLGIEQPSQMTGHSLLDLLPAEPVPA